MGSELPDERTASANLGISTSTRSSPKIVGSRPPSWNFSETDGPATARPLAKAGGSPKEQSPCGRTFKQFKFIRVNARPALRSQGSVWGSFGGTRDLRNIRMRNSQKRVDMPNGTILYYTDEEVMRNDADIFPGTKSRPSEKLSRLRSTCRSVENAPRDPR
jgi:hypothetical protein